MKSQPEGWDFCFRAAPKKVFLFLFQKKEGDAVFSCLSYEPKINMKNENN